MAKCQPSKTEWGDKKKGARRGRRRHGESDDSVEKKEKKTKKTGQNWLEDPFCASKFVGPLSEKWPYTGIFSIKSSTF